MKDSFDLEAWSSRVRLIRSCGHFQKGGYDVHDGTLNEIEATESALRNWVDQARADRTKGRTGLTTEEREELRRLRKENRVLRTEREIQKNAAAFFAKESA